MTTKISHCLSAPIFEIYVPNKSTKATQRNINTQFTKSEIKNISSKNSSRKQLGIIDQDCEYIQIHSDR